MWEIVRNTPVLDPLTIVSNSPIYFIQEGDIIVSFVAVKKYFKTYEIGTVYTNPKYRGKGYASDLMNYILEKHDTVFLLCRPAMISFYEKFGFFECSKCDTVINIRRMLFNIFLAPFTKHSIVSMQYIKSKLGV